MQSIKTYFADLSQRLGLADELIVLSPKRRVAKQPIQLGEVKERCRPDGPTTRLYDLEVAEGLHEGAEVSAAEQAPAPR
ncbi:hypothetical protein [Billgrantia desiderata]|uniref:hypothetical protein n=1 Tax=Billgrantia desiderata TaxID=52021 RepID=UPI001F187229|nr:hypothetical protein [Halomonas desiderata]MCE8013401.1 hypothetical protein [Halomonas desiderata]